MSSLGFRPSSADTPEGLALKGLDYFNSGKYEKARRSFETLLNQYPFSEYGLLAELKTADSNYYLKNYEEALLLYRDFEEHHPTNESIPYVMLQIGMCYYQQMTGIDQDQEILFHRCDLGKAGYSHLLSRCPADSAIMV